MHFRQISITLIMALLGFIGAIHAEDAPRLLPVPNDLPAAQRAELNAKRNKLIEKEEALSFKMDVHNKECSSVERGSSQAQKCQKDQRVLGAEVAAHIKAVNEFNKSVKESARNKPRISRVKRLGSSGQSKRPGKPLANEQ